MAIPSNDDLRLICGNRNYSSWSLRAWLCLRRAGLEPALTVLPMDTEQFKAEIGRHSPTGRVPVLWMGDEAVWDSLAIAETVNERYAAGALWPENPVLKARGRAMAAEMHSGFEALRHQLPMNCRARARRIEIDEAARRDVERICDLWSEARDLADGDDGWLLGAWSLVDAMFAPVAIRFRAYGLDLPASARSYVQRWLSDADLAEWIRDAEAEEWVIDHEEVGEDPD